MNFIDGDQPLGEQFLQNPYEFFQSFVRNMNNEVFLSEYQLSHLYALLLLKKQSPWDQLKSNSQNMKLQVEQMVNRKVVEVKKLLESLSQVYEDKLKKNTFTQIERLMSILKAKNKSIFIQKNMQNFPNCLKGTESRYLKQLIKQKLTEDQQPHIIQIQKQKELNNKNCMQDQKQMSNNKLSFQTKNQNVQQLQSENINVKKQQIINQQQNTSTQHQCQQALHNSNINQPSNEGDQREVLSLFYGIANIPNLSALALGNCLEYSAAERYIKFKMSKNYIMTIKNDDQFSFDRVSALSNVSSDLFIYRIFPYLTALQLFKVRGVCKEWMQNVKQAWHSTFKRQMFIQLMACEFCKQIQFYYKMIQLRNPFFQKISLLMHALIQIIQWDKVYESINNNTIVPQLKKVLIILLKLLGEQIITPNLNSITEEVWQQHKEKTLTLKQKISLFLNNIESSGLSIVDLLKIKIQLLDDPFMRVEELSSEDKTPLLLVIFIKQLTLQQILKNHIYFAQQYLMNTKRRLDNISSKMPQQKGFLQGVYKIILLRSFGGKNEQKDEQEEKSQMPNFASILTSIFDGNQDMDKPDFVLKSKSSLTNIYMDKATKLDIIVSTVKKMNAFEFSVPRRDQTSENFLSEMQNQNQLSNKTQVFNRNQKNEQDQDGQSQKKLQTINIQKIGLNSQQKSVQQNATDCKKTNIQIEQNQVHKSPRTE